MGVNTSANNGVILLVDNTPSDVRPLSDFLTDQGFDVHFASSGWAAIQAAGDDPPDIILLDVKMPEMDGYEVCERLKANMDLKGIPVLFIGGLDEPMDKTKGFEVGGADYITKPFEFVEVLARVNTHLNNARMKNQLELVTRELDAVRKASEMLHGDLEGQVRRRTAELEDVNKALREIKAQFEAVYNHHYQLTGLIDNEGRLLMGNRTALELAGVETQDVIGKFFWETPWWTHSKEAQHKLQEAMARAMRGEMVQFDTTHISAAGETRNIDFRIGPVFDDDGAVIYLVPEGYDITERKQAEEALRESEEVYRTLVENANSIILKWDTNGHIIYLNPYGLEYFKYKKEDVIGKHVLGTIVPENEATGSDLREMMNNIAKDPLEYKNNLNQNICSDGELVWVEWTNEAILDASGKFVEILSIGNDVTERKLAQEALRKSELWLNCIFNSLEEAVLVVTPDRKLVNINQAAKRMFGYSRAELRNLSTEVLHVDHEHYLEFGRRIKKAFDTGEAANFEFEAKRKNGEIFPTKHTESLLKNKQGEPLGIVSVVRDITAQKREEEEKKTLEAQLQRAEKMEAIGTLAGGVAHDLNNVLSGIVSYPDLLLIDLPEDSPLRKAILTMQSAGKKAVAIVQDLLTMARRGVVIADVVNLNDIISNYLKSLEYKNLLSFHPGVEVKTKLEADLPNLSGSSVHLSKIVMNLVSNAAEAMPLGGKIFISTENRYVDRPPSGYDSVEEGFYVVLTVSDPGAGISPKDIKRIFEPFYTKKVMGRSGTGLGMAVVWGTVKDHNGYIDVQSAETKGTTFTLYFPATQEDIAKEKAPLSIEDYMGNKESILVVDDVKDQRELALTLLAKLGYAAETISSGVEAVEYLKEHRVDLIVLDMIMDPGIDGLETYKKIIEMHPRQKAIIASGFSETDRVQEAQRLGAGQYIKKPYTLEKLGLAIKEELGR
jgi:PAS domain S-box-containing protein